MKENTSAQQNFCRLLLIFGLALSAVHIVLDRILAWVSSDILLQSFVRPLDWAIIIFDALLFFICYGILTTAIIHFGKRESFSVILLVFAITLVKHLGNWFVFLLSENVTSALNIRLSATTAAGSIGIEFLQHALVLALLILFTRRNQSAKGAFLGIGGIMVAINVLSRLMTDIEYGAPTSIAETLVMILYYTSDVVLYGLLGYLLMSFLYRKLSKDPQ